MNDLMAKDYSYNTNLPWVLIEIAGVIYALPCELVLSLHPLGTVTPLPQAPESIRGVIDFRGQIIELINIQKLLGVTTTEDEVDEFYKLMDLRLQDHINWIQTLEKCTKEGVAFTLTTDPHKCAFGKWYDAYKTSDLSIMFHSVFSKFDAPHKAIHAIGTKADELIKRGHTTEAVELIERAKDNELQQMIHIFDEVKLAFKESNREIVVVFGDGKNNLSIAVKKIVAIEYLTDIDPDFIKTTITNTEYLTGVGKRKDGSFVLLLNEKCLMDQFLKKE